MPRLSKLFLLPRPFGVVILHVYASTHSGTRIYPEHRPSTRGSRLSAVLVELRPSFARSLHEVLEQPEASRARRRKSPDQSIRSDRHLLRRSRASDARLSQKFLTRSFL